jgi:diguanylate cyclase (GGDEF)-like protein
MKILIVESNDVQRQLLETTASKAGNSVLAASDGQTAWAMIQSEHPRVIILDGLTPFEDGIGLVQQIRKTNWSVSIYIILLTVKEPQSNKVAGLIPGVNDYIIRPFEPEELLIHLEIYKRMLDLESKLNELTRHDLLTGLLNRRSLYESAEAELSRAVREGIATSIILLDLDHFKAVNDRLGNLIGDHALRLVAITLQQSMRIYDSIGLWGGEEFLVLLPNTDLANAAIAAERLRLAIETTPLRLPGSGVASLTASLGVTSTSLFTTPQTLDALLQQADQALFQAKSTGRNRLCLFTP